MVTLTKEPVVQEPTVKPITARREMIDWAWDQIKDKADVGIPTLGEMLKNRFMDDPAFCKRYVEEHAARICYIVAQEVVAYGRRQGADLSIIGATIIQGATLEKQIAAAKERWARWFEHVEPGRNVSLLKMTRDDLLAAAQYRYTQANAIKAGAILCERLASKLSDDQVVEDVFTVEQIDAEWATIVEQIKESN